MSKPLETIDVDADGRSLSAETFLRHLDQSNDRWWNEDGSQRWVFRGLGTTDYSLTPSSRRPLSANALAGLIRKTGDIADPRTWCHAEKQAVDDFIHRACSLGLEVYPSRNVKQRLGIDAPSDPTPDFLKAQHHGIPTKYLDWTFNPLVAAHFAVTSALEHVARKSSKSKSPHEHRLCVWAFDTNETYLGNFTEQLIGKRNTLIPARFHLEFDEPSQNSYLRMQQGLFVRLESNPDELFFRSEGRWPSMEDYCDPAYVYGYGNREPILRKYVLPEGEFIRLAVLLERSGISRSALMPTLDNVATEILAKLDR